MSRSGLTMESEISGSNFEVTKTKCVFVMIFNIPQLFRSNTLRNYFGQLIDTDRFVVFHYRHRPMALGSRGGAEQPIDESAKLNQPQTSAEQSNCCCLVLCKEDGYRRLVTAYHMHHWKDEESKDYPSQCHVYPIYCVKDVNTQCKWDLSDEYVVSSTDEQSSDKLYIPYEELIQFKELNPPDIMPQGNIGTPTKHFLQLINSCSLPPIVVKKLGLKFKKGQDGKVYSSVPYDYSNPCNTDNLPASHMLIGPAVTSQGHKIVDHSEYVEAQLMESRNKNNFNASLKSRALGQAGKTKGKTPAYKSEQPTKDAVDEDAEEWDRHEMFYDDSANIERNKERLYEEKIELKWEKGGSGLVFYTDAQYWKKLEGDFDEQTADDWDVDMSEYEEVGSGDKDARDFIAMRAEDRLRSGLATKSETSVFKRPIGSFERHTKGVGRTILESQGWVDGKGVGKAEKGRAEIIDSEGKLPKDRTGLGYHGEKVNRYVTRKRPVDQPIIATIYDKPSETDQSESDSLLERVHHHTIKYRRNDQS